MTQFEFQKLFLEQLAEKAKGASLVEVLQQRFNIGKSAAYNRIKGQTELTAGEMVSLSQEFDISLDGLLGRPREEVNFVLPSLSRTPRTVKEFFAGVRQYNERLEQQDQAHIHYVTNEIPLFQYFFYPELTAFKLFIWARSIWNWEYVQDQKFSVSRHLELFNLPKETESLLSNYAKIPSTEFWNSNILNNTINQIKYYQAADGFESQKDIDAIYLALDRLLVHAERMAKYGQKFSPIENPNKNTALNFNLYFNQFIYTNNTILATSKNMNSVFATFDNPNFMKSDDNALIKYTLDWFNSLKKRSTKISMESEKDRSAFFGVLSRKVEKARGEVSVLY